MLAHLEEQAKVRARRFLLADSYVTLFNRLISHGFRRIDHFL